MMKKPETDEFECSWRKIFSSKKLFHFSQKILIFIKNFSSLICQFYKFSLVITFAKIFLPSRERKNYKSFKMFKCSLPVSFRLYLKWKLNMMCHKIMHNNVSVERNKERIIYVFFIFLKARKNWNCEKWRALHSRP